MRTGVPAASSARIDLPASLHRLVTLVPRLLPSSSAAQHITSTTATAGRHGLLCPTTRAIACASSAPWRALVCSPVTRIHPSMHPSITRSSAFLMYHAAWVAMLHARLLF